jgi:hypothetical protein
MDQPCSSCTGTKPPFGGRKPHPDPFCLIKFRSRYPKLIVTPCELATFAVEKRHCLIHGVEYNPVPPQNPTRTLPDPFDLCASKILEIVMVIGRQLVLSHDTTPLVNWLLVDMRINIRL